MSGWHNENSYLTGQLWYVLNLATQVGAQSKTVSDVSQTDLTRVKFFLWRMRRLVGQHSLKSGDVRLGINQLIVVKLKKNESVASFSSNLCGLAGVGKGITKYMGSTPLIESVGEVSEGALKGCVGTTIVRDPLTAMQLTSTTVLCK